MQSSSQAFQAQEVLVAQVCEQAADPVRREQAAIDVGDGLVAVEGRQTQSRVLTRQLTSTEG